MRIVADKNIPFAEEAFSLIGSVELFPGREIGKTEVQDADVLLVRTVTDVNESLLDGSNVKFVGTATIGFDHIDTGYLDKNSIGFSYAPGSNANSVAEYIVSALFTLAGRMGFRLRDRTAGIIGCGNVGSRVREKLEILGVRTLLNDPPLHVRTGDNKYLPLETLLEEADIITAHVPLTEDGPHPTFHMFGGGFFSKVRKKPVFINSSRGAVCDSVALLSALAAGNVSHAVLDVWENEPDISAELLKKCALGTPHIAGYSLDGKANATKMLFDAVCRHFKINRTWEPEGMPPPKNPVIRIDSASDCEKTVGEAAGKAYNISADDSSLRKILKLRKDERGRYFDSLRNNYPVRREFKSFTADTSSEDKNCMKKLHKLGFKTAGFIRESRKQGGAPHV